MFKYRGFNSNAPDLTERREDVLSPTPDEESSLEGKIRCFDSTLILTASSQAGKQSLYL